MQLADPHSSHISFRGAFFLKSELRTNCALGRCSGDASVLVCSDVPHRRWMAGASETVKRSFRLEKNLEKEMIAGEELSLNSPVVCPLWHEEKNGQTQL